MFTSTLINSMFTMGVMQFLMDRATAKFEKVPGVSKELFQIVKMDDYFITINSVEAFLVREIFPVGQLELGIDPVFSGTSLGFIALLCRNGDPNSSHSVLLAQVN